MLKLKSSNVHILCLLTLCLEQNLLLSSAGVNKQLYDPERSDHRVMAVGIKHVTILL